MGHNKSFSVNTFSAHDDDFEFDEAYFRTFYKPLSNLPTPPLSSQSSSATQSPRMLADDAEPLNSDLLAPAIHLTRMLPPGLSLEDPSVATVHTMLTHANLPMDSIALATCVLDALPGRYRNAWRMSYPRSRQTSAATKRHTLPSGPIQPPAQSDAVLPEVNILAALIIATKFVEDLHEPTAFFASEWGRDLWSCEQINVTERCIMEALGYRILPLWEEQYIKMARHDIELVRRELLDEGSELAAANREYEFSSAVAGPDAAAPARPMSSGRATLGLGLQLTPTETPKTERATTPPLSQTDLLARETREAFSKSPPVPRDYLHLPLDATPRP